MSGLIHLYVDDLRFPWDTWKEDNGWDEDGDLWVISRTFHDAICQMEQHPFTIVSLDHDLGPESVYGYKEMKGRDILNWMIFQKMEGRRSPAIVRVHSANVVGCETMEADIKRYWPR